MEINPLQKLTKIGLLVENPTPQMKANPIALAILVLAWAIVYTKGIK